MTSNLPQQGEAGPSSSPVISTAALASSSAKPSGSTLPTAPHRHLPKVAYASIEYPGPVSSPSAILKLVSASDINDCFNTPLVDNPVLELNYRADQLGAPVRGYRVGSQKLLVRVIKRRRRRKESRDDRSESGSEEGQGEEEGGSTSGSRKGKEKSKGEGGVFTAEVVGPITQTVRFRSMADYHYTPNLDGPTGELVSALRDLDYETILQYTFPPVRETYINDITPPPGDGEPDPELCHKSLLDLQPIPIHSYTRVPPIYNFRMPPASVVEDWEDPITGEVKRRYVNKSRFAGFGPTVIGHTTPPGEVPSEPVKGVLHNLPKMDQELLEKLRKLFEERPVWIRYGLLTHLTADEVRELSSHKFYIPAVAYTFGAGPYWKCLVRLGYDPRQDVSSRIYQRIYFYYQVNRGKNLVLGADTPSAAPTTAGTATPGPGEDEGGQEDEEDEHDARGVRVRHQRSWEAQQEKLVEEGKRPPIDRSRGHIFDGKVLHRARPDYQLCDITDPLIEKYIHDPRLITEHCDARDGWYKPSTLNLIRNMVRTKYMHLRRTGEPAKDSLCYSHIEEYERTLLEEEKEDAQQQNEAEDRMNVDQEDSGHREHENKDKDKDQDGETGDDEDDEHAGETGSDLVEIEDVDME